MSPYVDDALTEALRLTDNWAGDIELAQAIARIAGVRVPDHSTDPRTVALIAGLAEVLTEALLTRRISFRERIAAASRAPFDDGAMVQAVFDFGLISSRIAEGDAISAIRQLRALVGRQLGRITDHVLIDFERRGLVERVDK